MIATTTTPVQRKNAIRSLAAASNDAASASREREPPTGQRRSERHGHQIVVARLRLRRPAVLPQATPSGNGCSASTSSISAANVDAIRERNHAPGLGERSCDTSAIVVGCMMPGASRLQRIVDELGREIFGLKRSGIDRRLERRERMHQESSLVRWQNGGVVVVEPLGKARGDRGTFGWSPRRGVPASRNSASAASERPCSSVAVFVVRAMHCSTAIAPFRSPAREQRAGLSLSSAGSDAASRGFRRDCLISVGRSLGIILQKLQPLGATPDGGISPPRRRRRDGVGSRIGHASIAVENHDAVARAAAPRIRQRPAPAAASAAIASSRSSCCCQRSSMRRWAISSCA